MVAPKVDTIGTGSTGSVGQIMEEVGYRAAAAGAPVGVPYGYSMLGTYDTGKLKVLKTRITKAFDVVITLISGMGQTVIMTLDWHCPLMGRGNVINW